MPSYITSPIYEGEDMTVQQFMERVARSMTDFFHMRDDYDSPLVRRNTRDYYRGVYDEAFYKLVDFLSLDDNGLIDLHRKQIDEAKRATEQSQARIDKMTARYQDMIDQVKSMEFPEELEYARDAALDYLEESMRFDCVAVGRSVTKNFDDWKRETENRLTRQLSSASKEYHDAIDRDKEFNEKIDLWSQVVGYEIKDKDD